MSNFRQVNEVSPEQVSHIIDLALAEDLGPGDITTDLLIPPEMRGKAIILVKARGIVVGGEIARQVFLRHDPSLAVAVLIKDGSEVKPGDIMATISGKVASILRVERTALNFLQRLSGIASQTALFVAQTRGLSVHIADTRKTTPGLRLLEKYAVRMGGGYNHRFNLHDGIIIKDNHLAALRALGMSLKEIVARAKKNAPPGVTVEVEVTNADEALEAVEGKADMIMLDNMTTEEMNYVVDLLPPESEIEASGGITLDNVRQAALARVNIISIGALTHSSKALNMSLELEPDSIKLAQD